MAKVIWSGLVQDVSGSTGATTFSSWKGLHYMKLKASAVSNPMTVAQTMIRSYLTASVAEWRALTSTQKALWEEYAQSQGAVREDEKQEGYGGMLPPPSRLQSGFNAYIGINQRLLWSAPPFARVSIPPIPPSVPGLFFDTATWTTPNIDCVLSVIGTLPQDTRVLVWAKGAWKGSHAQVRGRSVVMPAGTVAPITTVSLTSIVMGANGIFAPVPFTQLIGRTIDIQALAYDKLGNRSNATLVRSVLLT